ncbi:MAG: SH3 domain-containing protein [Oscillospiraceae bacterium]|nr:SH3 domain-containing protein [Oscillospiraceae bacterium]
MEQLFLSTTNLLVIGWTIACFIFYHKIFRVYYFNLARGLLKEIIGCVIAGYILTVLTLQHATPFAIGLIIVGWLITRNIDVDGVRNICFLLVLTVAIMIFFSGKKFESNLEEKSEVNNSNVAIQSDETYYAEIGVQPTAGIIETAPVELPYIPQETATSSGSDKPTVPESSQPSNGLPAATVPENTYLTGYVVESSGGLKIRNGPGTTYQEIGRLAPKEQVVIYEQVYSESYMWGRIDRGWICMDYIVMGTAPKYEETYAIGYIIGSDDGVNVRSGPAVSYDQVGKVYLGQRVVVTKLHHMECLNGDILVQAGFVPSIFILVKFLQNLMCTETLILQTHLYLNGILMNFYLPGMIAMVENYK